MEPEESGSRSGSASPIPKSEPENLSTSFNIETITLPFTKKLNTIIDSKENIENNNNNTSINHGDKQQFCLRWNNYHTNIFEEFQKMRENDKFIDVTLSCDRQNIKAHRLV